MQHKAYFIIFLSVFVLKIYADCPHQRGGLQKWSEWSQKPTQTMQDITIPSGTSILLDVSPPLMHYLKIEGDLIFDERNLTLDAHFIYLMNGGHLWIGNIFISLIFTQQKKFLTAHMRIQIHERITQILL